MKKKFYTSNDRLVYVTDEGIITNEDGKELSIQKDNVGYCSVFIAGKRYLVHRIVYMSFFGEIPEGYQIHHINGNKSDNRVSNLKMMSMKDHQNLHKQKYPFSKVCVVCGKEFVPNKTKRKCAKTCSYECWLMITKENATNRKKKIVQEDLNGNKIKIWDSARDIQNETGYFESNINKCCKGKVKTYKGYVWKYF